MNSRLVCQLRLFHLRGEAVQKGVSIPGKNMRLLAASVQSCSLSTDLASRYTVLRPFRLQIADGQEARPREQIVGQVSAPSERSCPKALQSWLQQPSLDLRYACPSAVNSSALTQSRIGRFVITAH
jgi:hypothetical protein